jgi:hypothetical protein
MRAWWFILALLGVLLYFAFPAESQEPEPEGCFNVGMSIVELDKYTKAQNLKARAYLWQSQHPGVEMLIVWFNNVPDAVFVSAFRKGCLVPMADGQSGRVLKIDPDITRAVNDSEVLFDNGGESPFTSY